jgi:DNA-binding transcriptional LysR family regulator
MPRLEANRSGEMEVFARVVELGGFSAAARAFRMTPSAVSKLVARLESRLGVRLVNRSTRRLQLTPEGKLFHERCLGILADMAEAEREAASGTAPRGRLRVNANVPFGLHCLLPLLPGFLALHPEVSLDVALTDQVIDLLEQRADIAIRTGPLAASRLVGRKLGESRMAVVAAPDYIARHGVPRRVADLERHNRIGFNFARRFEEWPFLSGGGVATVPASGNIQVGDGETARRLALAGVGLARLAWFHIGPDIEAGRLAPLLEAHNPGDVQEIHAVYVGQGGYLPARVRAFIDYLVATVRLPAPGKARIKNKAGA